MAYRGTMLHSGDVAHRGDLPGRGDTAPVLQPCPASAGRGTMPTAQGALQRPPTGKLLAFKVSKPVGAWASPALCPA